MGFRAKMQSQLDRLLSQHSIWFMGDIIGADHGLYRSVSGWPPCLEDGIMYERCSEECIDDQRQCCVGHARTSMHPGPPRAFRPSELAGGYIYNASIHQQNRHFFVRWYMSFTKLVNYQSTEMFTVTLISP